LDRTFYRKYGQAILLIIIDKYFKVDYPGALSGGEKSSTRFDIPRGIINIKDDIPFIPDIPYSRPDMIDCTVNFHKSVRELDKNPVDVKRGWIRPSGIEKLEGFMLYIFTPVFL
jgi:hypothetical protein